MELLQFIFSSTKDGAAWGMFSFSLVINFVLLYAIKSLNATILGQSKDIVNLVASTTTAVSEARNAVNNNNMLLQLLVGGKRPK